MKIILVLLCLFLSMNSLTSCGVNKSNNLLNETQCVTTEYSIDNKNENTGIDKKEIYEDDDIIVFSLKPADPPVIVDSIWDMPIENELYDSDVIADVIIDDLQEISISYTFMNAECVTYKTLITVHTNNVYYSSRLDMDNAFTIALPTSSYAYDEAFPDIAIGQEYIMFISSTDDLDDSLKLSNYADFYVSCPANIVEIHDTECVANSLFYAYSSCTVPLANADNASLLEGEILDEQEDEIAIVSDEFSDAEKCVMPLSDFESTLKSKIK